MQKISTVEVPSFSPRLKLPGLITLRTFLPASALIAFLSLGSHLTVVERIRRPGDHVEPRQELFALGAASLCAAAAGGMPVMPNLAVCQSLRDRTGGVALLGNAAGHLVAFYVAATCAPIQQLPACAISAIVFVEFTPLLLEVPKDVKHLFSQMKHSSDGHWTWRSLLASDLAIYVAAVLSPIFFGIIQGSVAAIALELLFAMNRFAGPGFAHLGRVAGTFDVYDELGVHGSTALELDCIGIVRFSGPRWFGNCVSTTRIARRQRQASGKVVNCIVVDMSMVSFLDETAVQHYKREWVKDLGYRIIISNCCSRVRKQLDVSGIAAILRQPPETFISLHAAVRLAEGLVAEIRDARPTGDGDAQVRARRPTVAGDVSPQ